MLGFHPSEAKLDKDTNVGFLPVAKSALKFLEKNSKGEKAAAQVTFLKAYIPELDALSKKTEAEELSPEGLQKLYNFCDLLGSMLAKGQTVKWQPEGLLPDYITTTAHRWKVAIDKETNYTAKSSFASLQRQ